ncbi:MAG: hypothetical protein K6U12_04395 [Armatimonadetes bacterium]|nr:hypothetical protein [Armatimonadota bacterium]CUU35543.1 hypothetical protein DCOP10_114279 [Armatimonadetes bacterium DC]
MSLASVPKSPFRPALLALGMLALLFGIAAGLQRLGLDMPIAAPPFAHSLLMVGGFFGTLIGLERAVATRWRWGYLAPTASGFGALALVFVPSPLYGWLLINGASLLLIVLYGRLYCQHRFLPHALMGLGALCWLVGNGFWYLGGFVPSSLGYTGTLCWVLFLLLTIFAERLELNRLTRPTPGSRIGMGMGILALCGGMLLHAVAPREGLVLFGVGLLAIAGWLVRFDTARYTMRARGLTGFTGRTLMGGYFWLGVAGGAALMAPGLAPGFWADALLHAFFLGFVFSMVFAHAPIIFPSVTGWAVPYHSHFYGHVGVLHGSLLLRLVGDFGEVPILRQWGAALNGVAILLFLLNTVSAVLLARLKSVQG